jgi:two-component system, sensor histidine kinase and response regulator
MRSPARSAESVSQLRHGLRTPLNHITGYTEMLLEDASQWELPKTATALREILSEAQYICGLIGADTPQDSDVDSEIALLRRSLSAPVRQMNSRAAALTGLNEADIERIRSAAHILLDFVETGNLPSSVAPERLPHASAGKIKIKPGHGRLLVVDDDEANRDILRRHLERRGYEVDEASSGRDALAKVAAHSFEAVLLDLVMPDMDGLEVLEALKNQPRWAEIPVLVISASDDLTAAADSIQKGAEDYLVKPLDPVLLDARLSATLERKRLRDEERLRTFELEQLSLALKRSNEDLQRFAYAASHDLQAPVRTIITYLQLFQRRSGAKLTEEEAEMIEFAQGAATRMHNLIRDLLLYSRASTDACKLEPVDCQSLLRQLREDLDSLISESEAVISWDQSMPQLIADSTGLRQLFQNLISNAIKYRREGEAPKIHISASLKGDYWQFCVADNGRGIPREYSKRIFEMFQRLHGDELPGSGIGLAICQRIIERSGGQIWVDSEPERGSRFFFTLPLHQGESLTTSS